MNGDRMHAERFEVGEWVAFWTRNWPTGVQVMELRLGEPGSRDVTGEGLYMGRGKIVRVDPDGWLVQEERSRRLTKVASDERIRSLKVETQPLTLGHLRQFLAMHENAPDNIPITVSLPVYFNCDDEDDDFDDGHPEAHLANSLHVVSACNVVFTGYEENSGADSDSYVPPDEQEPGDDWHFSIELVLDPREAHDALRDCEGGW
jgi:hypothetical protein